MNTPPSVHVGTVNPLTFRITSCKHLPPKSHYNTAFVRRQNLLILFGLKPSVFIFVSRSST